jgi:hypothetical protein
MDKATKEMIRQLDEQIAQSTAALLESAKATRLVAYTDEPIEPLAEAMARVGPPPIDVDVQYDAEAGGFVATIYYVEEQ